MISDHFSTEKLHTKNTKLIKCCDQLLHIHIHNYFLLLFYFYWIIQTISKISIVFFLFKMQTQNLKKKCIWIRLYAIQTICPLSLLVLVNRWNCFLSKIDSIFFFQILNTLQNEIHENHTFFLVLCLAQHIYANSNVLTWNLFCVHKKSFLFYQFWNTNSHTSHISTLNTDGEIHS